MRRNAKAKTFASGELVRVCPTSEHHPRPNQFVDAIYTGKVANMRGWHHVDVTDDAHARHIDRATGIGSDVAGPNTFTTRSLLVPTHRIRKATS